MNEPVHLQAFSARFPMLFLIMMGTLMACYHLLPAHVVEDVLVRYFAVVPGAWVLDLLTPAVDVMASGNRIVSPGTSLNVLKGCEGIEMLLLLYAAIIAMLRPLKVTLIGLLMGTLLIFVVNQMRIVTLFFVARTQGEYFELLHGFLAPMLIVFVAGLFFLYWLNAMPKPNYAGAVSDG